LTNRPGGAPVLLALDAGVRQTGWAVFESKRLLRTGVIDSPKRNGKRNGLKGRDRITNLIAELDHLAEDSHPDAVACCQPSGIHWSVPSIRLLDESLLNWSETRKIGFFSYTTQEIRAAIAGFANASPDRLGYAIMVRLGLIGQRRSTHEWEAVAVGYYHHTRPTGPSRSTGRT